MQRGVVRTLLVVVLFFWSAGGCLWASRGGAFGEDSVAFRAESGQYLLFKKDRAGQWQLGQVFSRAEYLEYARQKMIREYFSSQYQPWSVAEDEEGEAVPRRFTFRLSGNALVGLSQEINETDDVNLPVGLRREKYVDFTHRTNLYLQAKYGEHIGLNFLYNTESAIEYQRRRFNLYYAGNSSDLVEKVEVGDLQFLSANPLITVGGEKLYGLKGYFHLGGVDLQVIASREETKERRMTIWSGQKQVEKELRGSDYDFAQHFFLSEFFAQRYDEALARLPLVQSDFYVEQVEAWVSTPLLREPTTTKEAVRGFASLALEEQHPPSQASKGEEEGLWVASAERLPASTYTWHPTLGYISLQVPLSEGQVLLVAYRYRYQGKLYEVGTVGVAGGQQLEAALLAGENHSPKSPLWHLMMKNGYSLGAYPTVWNEENIRVRLLYKDYSSGTEQTTVEKGTAQGKSWLTLFGWDTCDASKVNNQPDGAFDFVEGVTYLPQNATLFLPQRRPFETVLQKVNEGGVAGYSPYSQLYDASKYEAKQQRELDRFLIRTEVDGGAGQLISLGATQLRPGSVRVLSAGGQELTEGQDYAVNYSTGQLSLSPHLPDRLEVVIQEPDNKRKQMVKTLLGAEANVALRPNLQIGSTLLRYAEESQRQRLRWGEETVKNLMWGMHLNYSKESILWTELLNEHLHLDLREPSKVELQSAFALFNSRSSAPKGQVILEDFEQGQPYLDLTYPKAWKLSSAPYKKSGDQRAQMAWYTIDPLLVREGAERQPEHLRNNPQERNNPFVREVEVTDLFPKHDHDPLQRATLSTLHLSFYPEERGPYNLNTKDLLPTGKMAYPKEMWGGMMRHLEEHNLEEQKYTYLEGWLLDPYYGNGETDEGMIYIDLGHLSDDVLPDGEMTFETPLPKVETEWGKAPQQQPLSYGFDFSGKVPMRLQDVGLEGLSSAEEAEHPKYAAYLREVEAKTQFQPWRTPAGTLPGDPSQDPAGDDYRFFLGEAWDQMEAPIPLRYKYINGVEGNSINQIIQGVQSAYTWEPDAEDLNRDLIFATDERYFRYQLPISRSSLSSHSSYVVAERIFTPKSSNNTPLKEERWVKIRIPLREPVQRIGDGATLQDVRAIRLSLTGFSSETHLRWARLRLVATPWSHFEQPIDPADRQSARGVSITTLGVEEDEGRTPIPYVSPQGVEREEVLAKLSRVREDERALSLKVEQLEPSQPVAVYQEMSLDLRHFEQLEMFVHLESPQVLRHGDVELFIRLGHDFTENYYELQMPLDATPNREYDGVDLHTLQGIIWPESNKVQLLLSLLPQLKTERSQDPTIDPRLPFERSYPERPEQKLVVCGYPTLGNISSVLIGIRSKARSNMAVEVWFNELSASGDKDSSGQAFHLNAKTKVADLAELQLTYLTKTAGFGTLKSHPHHSPLQDEQKWRFLATVDLGKLLPSSWQVVAPLTFFTQKEYQAPLFAPEVSDLHFKDWQALTGKNRGATSLTSRSLALRDWHIIPHIGGTTSPFSPSLFRFSYDAQEEKGYSPQLSEYRQRESRSSINYSYEPSGGSYIRLTSSSQRLFQHSEYTEGGANLRSQWNWRRAIHLRYNLLPGLYVRWQSQTDALIPEPFEKTFRENGTAEFELLSQEILRSIAQLGETTHYRGQAELGYQLPYFRQKSLNGLTGGFHWQSLYQWDRGMQYGDIVPSNPIRNRGEWQVFFSYDRTPIANGGAEVDEGPLLRFIAMTFTRQIGSSVPGFLPTAGKALGITTTQQKLSPSLGYILALTPNSKELQRMAEKGWIETAPQLERYLSYYHSDDFNGECSFHPLPGLQLKFFLRYYHQQHSQLRPSQATELVQQSGSLKFSTIGLKRFFQAPEDLRLDKTKDDGLTSSFLRSYTLSSHLSQGLPSVASMLPNWSLSYELVRKGNKLSQHFNSFRFSHSYFGELEVPRYLLATNEATETYTPQSLVQKDEMNPLIGINLDMKKGLMIEEKWIRRYTTTLLVPTEQLIQQTGNEISSYVSYRHTFRPLFKSRNRLLQSTENLLLLHFNHRYTHSEMQHHQVATGATHLTQGLKTHFIECSGEYTLSDAISLRAFYQETRSTPLVTNYTYPIRRRSYGILLNLQLPLTR